MSRKKLLPPGETLLHPITSAVEKIDLAQMHLQELKNLMQKKKVKEINPEKTDALENQSQVE